MDLQSLSGTAEVIGAALIGALVVYHRVSTGSRITWRDEAEAFAARSERLSDDVARLLTEVAELRTDNAALREEVAALRVENRELRTHIDSLIERGNP